MSISNVRAFGGVAAATGTAAPHVALRVRNSFSLSSRRRCQPRKARRIFCMRVGMDRMISSTAMSQERLEASLDIDLRSAREIVRIIQEQDALVAGAVAAEADRIAHAIDQIADRMTHGGRLFYVGAGTSGRIAMLDASELPPTYGIDPSLVRVLMAGGGGALFHARGGGGDGEEGGGAAGEGGGEGGGGGGGIGPGGE